MPYRQSSEMCIFNHCHQNLSHSLHHKILTEPTVILTTWLSILMILFVNNDRKTCHSVGSDMFIE